MSTAHIITFSKTATPEEIQKFYKEQEGLGTEFLKKNHESKILPYALAKLSPSQQQSVQGLTSLSIVDGIEEDKTFSVNPIPGTS